MLHRESRETYGRPRIWDALLKQGHGIGEHRVARFMRQDGLRTKPVTESPVAWAEHTLHRQSTVAVPNRVGAGDIT